MSTSACAGKTESRSRPGFATIRNCDGRSICGRRKTTRFAPQSGRRQSFPEIDRIGYFALPAAITKILTYQRPLLIELKQRLAG